MKKAYLEVTFRHARPLAAYLYLPRANGEKSVQTSRVEPGMVIDFGQSGKPFGIEITAPGRITLQALNNVLNELGVPPVEERELTPLRAA